MSIYPELRAPPVGTARRAVRPPSRLLPILTLCLLVTSCRQHESQTDIRIFHAAGMTPFLEQLAPRTQHDGLHLLTESSGSQMAIRKVTELGRACDVLILADPLLIRELCADHCEGRLDFATDSMVLGVGARAPRVPEAETNWMSVVRDPAVRLARANETLGPIGYRTLLTLQLAGQIQENPDLLSNFVKHCELVVDDVERLPPLLTSGEADYAFLYRSTAMAHGVRFIPLDPRINLGSINADYRQASLTFQALKAGPPRDVTVTGTPIVWTLTVPRPADAHAAATFIRWWTRHLPELLESGGLTPILPPRYSGPATWAARYCPDAVYSGSPAP